MFFKNICVFFSSKSLSLCRSTFSIFGIFLLRREFLSEQGSEEGQLFVGPRLVEMWWQIVVHYNNGVRRPRRYLKISSGFLLCSHTFHLVLALIFIFISEHSFPLRRGHYFVIFPSLAINIQFGGEFSAVNLTGGVGVWHPWHPWHPWQPSVSWQLSDQGCVLVMARPRVSSTSLLVICF